MKSRALFLAGHPALDFLNTLMMVDRDIVDVLQSGEDVLSWLSQAGLPVPAGYAKTKSSSLARSARKLRESIRSLVEKRKAGQRGDPSVLNRFLAASRSYPQLVWNRQSLPKLEIVRRPNTSESILAPLAEGAADLLIAADFTLIKHCEGADCLLWFFDQTKSHRRRWCSPQSCGNRHKVAAYRNRLRSPGSSRS